MTDQDQIIKSIHKLLANLIGDRPRLHEMGIHRIYTEDLLDWPFEHAILQQIYTCEMQQVPPTRETITSMLVSAGIEDASDRLQIVMLERSSSDDIAGISFILKDVYLQRARNQRIMAQLNDLFSSAESMPRQQIMNAMELLSRETPEAYAGQRFSMQEALDTWLELQRERRRRRVEGLRMGPNWPFPALNDLVPMLKPGEMTTIMMKTKYGKSTLAGILGEHWYLAQGYEVLTFLLEINIASYMDRMISRNCLIPPNALRLGLFDPDIPGDHPRAYDNYHAFLGSLARAEHGSHTVIVCPGWGPADIQAAVDAANRFARSRGNELVVILDYYQQVSKSMFYKDSQPYNALADWLKTLVEQQQCYWVNMCQEKDDVKEPAEGMNIKKRSQVFMRMHREVADEDLQVVNAFRQPLNDAMDNERYYHRNGQLSSSVWLQVMLANDDQMGQVKLITEMAYFRMNQNQNNQAPPGIA